MTVGEMIKELRIYKGLTQRQLGELCGMADSAIRRYESDRANPKLETLRKIADALDTSIDVLLGDNWEKYLPHLAENEPLRSVPGTSYYLDDETRELVQFMFENPEYRVLFDASRKVKKEDIEFVKQMMDRLRKDAE